MSNLRLAASAWVCQGNTDTHTRAHDSNSQSRHPLVIVPKTQSVASGISTLTFLHPLSLVSNLSILTPRLLLARLQSSSYPPVHPFTHHARTTTSLFSFFLCTIRANFHSASSPCLSNPGKIRHSQTHKRKHGIGALHVLGTTVLHLARHSSLHRGADPPACRRALDLLRGRRSAAPLTCDRPRSAKTGILLSLNLSSARSQLRPQSRLRRHSKASGLHHQRLHPSVHSADLGTRAVLRIFPCARARSQFRL